MTSRTFAEQADAFLQHLPALAEEIQRRSVLPAVLLGKCCNGCGAPLETHVCSYCLRKVDSYE